jgi:hypothetical protein
LATDQPDPTWAALWARNQATLGLAPATNVDFSRAGNFTYPGYTRGVLAMAKSLGIAGADIAYNWLDGQFALGLALRNGGYLPWKWAMAC